MKKEKDIQVKEKVIVGIPGGAVVIGSQSVPTSLASVARTRIEDVVKAAYKASNMGTFSTENGI